MNKKVNLFLHYSKFHNVEINPIPSNRNKYYYCNKKCLECVVVHECHGNQYLEQDDYDYIKDHYPEYFL